MNSPYPVLIGTSAHFRRTGARLQPALQIGVTMLELILVLALMGIIASLVIPMLGSGVSTSELKSSARQLAAGLRLARSEALATRHETFLALDVEQRKFKVGGDPREFQLPVRSELKLYTAQKDLVSEKVGAIRFYPDGGSTGGRITIASGERKYEVDVDWLTGRVTIND